MTTDYKAFVRRWFDEVWNKGRTDAIDEMYAPDGIAHGFGPDRQGPAAFKEIHAMYRNAFPDLRIVVEDTVVEGDTVAARWSATATHQGPLVGLARTDKGVSFGGMTFIRMKDGKMVEGWNVFDQMGMMQQLTSA